MLGKKTYFIFIRCIASISQSWMPWYWNREAIFPLSQTFPFVRVWVLMTCQWMLWGAFLTAKFWWHAPMALPQMSIMPPMSFSAAWSWWNRLIWIDRTGNLKQAGITITFQLSSHMHEGLWILLWIIWVHNNISSPFASIFKVGCISTLSSSQLPNFGTWKPCFSQIIYKLAS